MNAFFKIIIEVSIAYFVMGTSERDGSVFGHGQLHAIAVGHCFGIKLETKHQGQLVDFETRGESRIDASDDID
jgi:hypothetical protein